MRKNIFKYIANKTKDKSAQALPEFALCLPLIMLMLGVLITVAQMVYAKEVLQAAAQSYCRAFVTSYEDGKSVLANSFNADKKGQAQAELIMQNAAMDIVLSNPSGGKAYEYKTRVITGNLTGEDGGDVRVIKTAKGLAYNYVEVTVHGAISTLFPVQWNNRNLTPDNLTFLEAYCAMIIER